MDCYWQAGKTNFERKKNLCFLTTKLVFFISGVK